MMGMEETLEHVKESHTDEVLDWIREYYMPGVVTSMGDFVLGTISRQTLFGKIGLAINDAIGLVVEAHDEHDGHENDVEEDE